MNVIQIHQIRRKELPLELQPLKGELDAIVNEISSSVILSAEKAVAHYADPQRYPITDHPEASGATAPLKFPLSLMMGKRPGQLIASCKRSEH